MNLNEKAQAIKKDKYGPEYIIEVYDPKIGMEGFLVIDNTVWGPGKGGIRMTSQVTKEEVYRLARTMTWKNALAGIPFGGAKAGIIWKGGDDHLKKQFVQSFAKAIKPFLMKKYIAGPDVNTGEKEMQWFVEAVGNLRAATGKPSKLCHPSGERCGLPHELGSTGFGVAQAAAIAIKMKGLDIKQTTVAIEGFGNVGEFTFKHLHNMSAKIVAVTDARGGVYDKNGLDEKTLLHLKRQKKSVAEYPGGIKIETGQIFGLPVDVLIPAAVTDSINDKNKNEIRAKIIVEGSNIPMRESLEEEFFKKVFWSCRILWPTPEALFLLMPNIEATATKKCSNWLKKIKNATTAVLKQSLKENRNPREVAMGIAVKRVEEKSENS